MRSKRAANFGAAATIWWLSAAVHYDALRAAPLPYLTAAWWWLRRKRVRARRQFEPLLSQSPRAYALWLLCQDKAGDKSDALTGPPIVALVDGSGARDGLDDTLRNLAALRVLVLQIGTEVLPTLSDAVAQIDWSKNPWLLPIVSGDTISPVGIAAYRNAVADQNLTDAATRIIYADDDLQDSTGYRHSPHFKPDWNSELFRYCDYLTGSCIVRAARDEVEALTDVKDWATQLVAQATARGTPLHLRRMLHHRRGRPVPRIPTASPQADDLPPVTLIIPTRNRVEFLRTCLDGVAATHYPDVEVIVVDNDSDDAQTLAYLDALDPTRYRVLRHAGAFNYSAINNRAAAEAQGRLLCLLNNDIEMIDPNWLAIMAAQAERDDVGAVGARLLYPDGRIQHAGVVLGVGNAAGHAHRFVDAEAPGYFYRHALPQFTSAVTAACLVVSRERFLAVGGLDEHDFPVAFNDVDLCLRLNQRGWQSLYDPRATLIHHESTSRGLDQDPVGAARFAGELAALKQRWHTDQIVDPFHHPQLSRASERFVVAL